jgi:hypothetical protein
MAFSRYRNFIINNRMLSIPSITIKERDTDKFVNYSYQTNRLDRISAEIYGDDTYWWVILMANPDYYMEYDIPTNTVIRVPFPLEEVLFDFQKIALLKINNNT